MQQDYERLFRLDESARNYRMKLLENVKFLLRNDRVLEASYFFNKLEKINPNNIAVIELGYELFLKKKDIKKLVEYDRKLFDKKNINFKLILNRTKYYVLINKPYLANDCFIYLFENEKLRIEQVIELANLSFDINVIQSYGKVCEYIRKNKLKIVSGSGDVYLDIIKRKSMGTLIEQLKKIKNQKLIDEVKNEK